MTAVTLQTLAAQPPKSALPPSGGSTFGLTITAFADALQGVVESELSLGDGREDDKPAPQSEDDEQTPTTPLPTLAIDLSKLRLDLISQAAGFRPEDRPDVSKAGEQLRSSSDGATATSVSPSLPASPHVMIVASMLGASAPADAGAGALAARQTLPDSPPRLPLDPQATTTDPVDPQPASQSAQISGQAIEAPGFTLEGLQTHFPPALAAGAREMVRAEAGDDPTALRSSEFEPTSPRLPAPIKILSFNLEPAHLGAINVRMRMTQSHVEIEISVGSTSTFSAVHDLKERLAAAISSTGCAVGSIDVSVSSAPAAPDMASLHSQSDPPSAEEREFAQGNFAQHGGSQDAKRGSSSHKETASASEGADRGARHRDVYL